MLTAVLIYLLVGAIAGLLAGVFGIGGGIVMVPALVFAFLAQQVDPAVTAHLAVGTSLATIVVTGASSAWGHWRRGSVRRDWLRMMIPGLLVGGILGVLLASALPGAALTRLFGAFALVMALKMLLSRPPATQGRTPQRWPMAAAGAVIGGVSTLFGVGGGVMSVPWLSRFTQRMTEAVGTSAAIGLPIALIGTVTNVVVGWGEAGLPSGATGFVMWPAFLGLMVTSVPMARVGVKVAHALPAKVLRRIFALLLIVVGFKLMLG
ncbi:sulfite exporter TauE/SafE family protein [Salinicola sp. DM10]|uniref:sulfite exporter TauE/SafE family protein n=1 Tax=Salinicola sp. DM10 TaxID=2815721 RepID=UPI001A8D006B|nr:sulfite exporter TauE/SafE family protein [Salinicola sp. DM10]MCE3027221.1 sulfite exporter TauE/SafE family protein [Salinicola sp. DM10]